MKKIIARIHGGLGNQLFCYAAARRLALVNNAELVIDDITGFSRDSLYARNFMLDHFRITARKATSNERLEPFERFRRGVLQWLSLHKPFIERPYLKQEGRDFDSRLLSLKVRGTLYLDGLWQSEGYFKDVMNVIRDDLRIVSPSDNQNMQIADKIERCNAIAVHVRWFDQPGNMRGHNVSVDYYQRAIALAEKELKSPIYFVFSDNPQATCAKISFPESRVVFLSHNSGDAAAYADLWLMTLCRHFIIANSTFSWWAAWLCGNPEKVIMCPEMQIHDSLRITSWNFLGQIPDTWIKI